MSNYENDLEEEARDYVEKEGSPSSEEKNYEEGESCGVGSCEGPGCGCEKNRCKLPMIAGLILLVALLVGGGYFFYQKVFGNPLNQLLIGMAEMYEEKEASVVSEVGFEMMDESKDMKKALAAFSELGVTSNEEELYGFLAAVLPNFKLKYAANVSMKPEDVKVGVKFDVLYKEKPLVDLLYHVKPWELRIGSEQVLSKPIYMDVAKLVKTVSGGMTDLSKLELKEYLEILYEKDEFIDGLKGSEYIKIVREMLEDKVTKEGSKLVLTLNNKENAEMVKKLFEVAKSDEKLKKFIVTKVTKILDLAAKRKDYELFGMTKEEFSAVSSIAKVQIDTNFENVLTEITKVYDSPEYLKAMNEVEDVAMKYVFTMSGKKIKEIDSSANIGGVLMKVHTMYGEKNAYLKEVEAKSGADVYDLSNVQEDPFSALSIATESLSNFDKKVLKGEAFKAFSEDAKSHAKEKLAEADAAKVIQFFDDIVPNLINNGLKSIMGGF